MKQLKPKVLLLILCVSIIVVFSSFETAKGQPKKTERGIRHEYSSQDTPRLALVIGNGEYASARKLVNPVNDAGDMTTVLRGLGFEVISGVNLDLKQMQEKVREFGDKLKVSGGVGLFYYAGHGVQANNRNYLIPIDAIIEREDEIDFAALNLDQILKKMATANNGLNIVILDACRNNPFARNWSRGEAEGGLAQITAPTGTFIAYATSPDTTAADGNGRNGLYTAELLKNIKQPNLKIEEAFKQVTIGVDKSSNGKQIPWVSSSLRGEFYFNGFESAKTPPTTKQTQGGTKQPDVAVPNEMDENSSDSSDPIDVKIERLTKKIKSNPQDALSYYYRGDTYLETGDFDQAIADFNKAIEFNPKLSEAFRKRADAYSSKKAYDQAIADYTEAIQLDSKNAGAYNGRGVIYYNKKNYEQATTNYDRAISLAPSRFTFYYNRGLLYNEIGLFSNESAYHLRAIADFSKAIELNPKDVQNYRIRAFAYKLTNNSQQALMDYSTMIELNPKDAEVYEQRGYIYEGLDEKEIAAANFKRAKELRENPDSTEIDVLTKLIETKPKDAEAYLNRGNSYAKQGDYAQAIADYTKTIEINPKLAEAYNNRAGVYYRKKDFTRAINDYTKAIKLNPQDARTYRNRGVTYEEMGEKENATADFRKAEDLDKKH
jgi:tetratricopeptide (TPR) repeat protein